MSTYDYPWYDYGTATSTTSTVTQIRTYSSTDTSATYDDNWTTLASQPLRTIVKEVVPDTLYPDKPMSIHLKDNTHIFIDKDHNLRIDDREAKVTYKSNRIREFNRYINASDLLEEFIREMGARGVKQSEILDVPIELFISWIIYKAAQQDGDEAEKPRIPAPQCLACGRFIPKTLASRGFQFCNPDHSGRYFQQIVVQ